MRRALLPLVLLPLAAGVQAKDIRCNVESDYDLTVNDQSVILTRASGTPKWIVIRGDRLFVDDKWVALEPDDRRRIAEFDRGTRKVMPLAREIGRDAADIAFTALGEVAAGFSSDPARTRAKLDDARSKIEPAPGARGVGEPLRFQRPRQGHRRSGVRSGAHGHRRYRRRCSARGAQRRYATA